MKKIKKSQVFILDLTFALILIVFSFLIILNFDYSITNSETIYKQNIFIIEKTTTQKINELDNDFTINLYRKNLVKNSENTIIDQIIDFNENNQDTDLKSFSNEFFKSIVPNDLNIKIVLVNSSDIEILLYENEKISFNESSITTSITRDLIKRNPKDSSSILFYKIKSIVWK